tara:strand:+ start:6757 stop:7230 length:474 start_codon:yes stop_codon:yes gene_type:complete
MSKNYINIYNNLIKFTRNKLLYKNTNVEEDFSIRLTMYLIHFAFFLKEYKSKNQKKELQDIYDYNFRQLEISIREIGYGDVSINKKMKDYLNLFHKIILDLDKWESYQTQEKASFFSNIISNKVNSSFFIEYFENYQIFLKKNSLNSFVNNILDFKN